jgi:integrase
MPLSALAINRTAPKAKPYKLSDGQGLHLLVQPSGRKLWRMRYRFGNRENMLSLGAFPIVPIAEARVRRDEVRKLISAGIDPALRRRLDKLSTARKDTFGAVAAEYLANLEANKSALITVSKNRWLLEVLAASIANRPIANIQPAELLDILQKIEKSGRRDTAHRLRAVMGSVFRLAVATLRAPNDPTFALRGALQRVNVRHRAAITDEAKLGVCAALIDDYDGWPALRCAFQFMILTMGRPGDVRGMKRCEVDFDKRTWRIPAERMKMRRPHDVPLSKQAVKVLAEVWPLNENCELVFPSLRATKKPLSENAFNSALRRMGYQKEEVTAHGFRSSASTILNERGANPDIIESALAHQDSNEIRGIYNRARYWPQRVQLMQQWADLLDALKTPAIRNASPQL